jgi:hypothetical protein
MQSNSASTTEHSSVMQFAHPSELIDRKRTALTFVKARPDLFRAGFMDWLDKNFHVWLAFEREANAIWARGNRHYSARTIGEYLRHETALREAHNHLQLKLNNNAFPSLARLYECHYPLRAGFFEKRVGQSAVRAA